MRSDVYVPIGRAAPTALVAVLSKNSQVKVWFSAFLDAHTTRSKPFLPCSIDGSRRLISTTVVPGVSEFVEV